MVEDSNPEPPPPPDIRPFGQRKSKLSSNKTADRANVKVNFAISAPSDNVQSSDLLERYVEEIKNEHAQAKRDSKSGKLRLPRHFPAFLFVLCIIFAVLPVASAHKHTNTNTNIIAADPYTSYDSITPKYNIKSTPILSTLGWLLRNVGYAFTHITGVEVDNTPIGHLKRALTKTEKIEAAMIPLCVILSGIFAGLTLGYFSVDPTQLQVLSMSGTPKQQVYARRILPIRKDSHLLLTTLILSNMIVNEALPVIADPVLGGGIQAVVASTAMVVVFAEIIPQSICSRYGLLIGATMARPVRVLIWLAMPIAWPVAKLLEYILGAHHGIIYRRSELRELIKMHAAGAEGGGDLDFDTVQIAQGALDLAQKVVKQAMTPIDQVFMLPIEAKLDYETLGHVVRSGHSRIPVYQMVEVPDINLAAPATGPVKTKMVKKVIGSLLVKSCVLLDPEDATPLASVPINAIPSVPYDEPMTNMLNVFQEGRSHMAIVSRRPRRVENDPEDAESVMTAAAGGLRQRFMRKVAEITHHGSDSDTSSSESDDADHAEKGEKKSRRKKAKRSTSDSSGTATAVSPTSTSAADAVKEKAKAQADEAEVEKRKKSGLVNATKLTQLEQTVPADAQMAPDAVEKFFEGLEGAPLGIITLEDVLEELIGEEIYDEYDEHGAPRSAASAFVPREAALAARKAALARQELAQAQSTPLPATNDADLEAAAAAAPAPRRVIPKLPIPKFSLGKRPISQPGRSRSAVPDEMKITSTAGPTPVISSQPLTQDYFAGGGTAPAGDVKRTASPGEMDVTAAAARPTDDVPKRSQSEVRIASRRNSSQIDPPASTAVSPIVPLKGLDPVSAVPARLLPSGVAATPNLAPPNANLLSEALLIERGRRRMAAGGTATPPNIVPPAILRAASATRGASATGTASNVPSRQPTPPSAGVQSTSTMSSNLPPTTNEGQIISPQPVAAGKRMPKFKSVPASAPGTGSVPGTPPL